MSSPPPLTPALTRRMLPLALVAGLVVGVVLPLVYQQILLTQRDREAQVWAVQLADGLSALAARAPRLWAYDDRRISSLWAVVVDPPVAGQVRLDLPGRPEALVRGRAPQPGGARGQATVEVGGRRAARVTVLLDAQGARAAAARLWTPAAILGALLAWALVRVPRATARVGDVRNSALYAAVEEANGALQEANAGLEARVAERTAELETRRRELQALSARLVMVQEEERKRLSRDLHDDLGQVLTGLRLQLTALEAQLGEAAAPAGAVTLAQLAVSTVDQGVERVRDLAHALRSPALRGLGAGGALAEQARAWAAQAGLTLTLDLGELEPPEELGSVLFRVAQEALTNVARHAQARRVSVRWGPADDGWRLEVEDDGVGMTPGREGAQERAAQAGGYLDLEESNLGGLRLVVWVPKSV